MLWAFLKYNFFLVVVVVLVVMVVIVVLVGSGDGGCESGSSKLLYLHDRKILQCCKS